MFFWSGPLQSLLMIISTTFFLLYLLRWKPFTSCVDFTINVVSTVVLIVLYFFCFLFSLLQQEDHSTGRLYLGYGFIMLVVLLFAFTVLTIIVSKIIECIMLCQKRR